MPENVNQEIRDDIRPLRMSSWDCREFLDNMIVDDTGFATDEMVIRKLLDYQVLVRK